MFQILSPGGCVRLLFFSPFSGRWFLIWDPLPFSPPTFHADQTITKGAAYVSHTTYKLKYQYRRKSLRFWIHDARLAGIHDKTLLRREPFVIPRNTKFGIWGNGGF